MNLYFLLEGKRTEPQLYRRWLAHALPDLREVRHANELDGNGFRLRSVFKALVDRRDETDHIESFGHLLTAWRGLGAEI